MVLFYRFGKKDDLVGFNFNYTAIDLKNRFKIGHVNNDHGAVSSVEIIGAWSFRT